MRIDVQEDACVAAGQCALVAGDVFDQDDDGIVVVLDANPPERLHLASRRAASLCPARAITVHD